MPIIVHYNKHVDINKKPGVPDLIMKKARTLPRGHANVILLVAEYSELDNIYVW